MIYLFIEMPIIQKVFFIETDTKNTLLEVIVFILEHHLDEVREFYRCNKNTLVYEKESMQALDITMTLQQLNLCSFMNLIIY